MIDKRAQHGFLAIAAAVILIVLAAMGAAMFAMVSSGTRGAGDHALSARALFLAESGIEWAAKDLFGTDDPEADCNGLAGSGPFTMPGGTFQILNSSYNASEGNCSVTSRGSVGGVLRTISGVIPKSIIEGGGGGLFDDSEDDFNNCNQQNLECQDGAMVFQRPSGGPGGGNTNTQAKGSDLINNDWTAGELVYFTANFDWDADPSGNVFTIEIKLQGGGTRTCTVNLPSLSSGCAAPSSNPLYDTYDVVLEVGNSYPDEDINSVSLSVNWGSNPSNEVTLADGCIGTEEQCSGAASDPAEDGSWDENP